VKLLLTSGGVTNASIRDARVDLLGKPIEDAAARGLPLRRDPRRAAQRGLVRAREADRDRGPLDSLGDKGRLAHLPRPGDHLDEPARLGEAPGQLGRLRAAVLDGLD
jgi:hypothetical protein